MDLFINSMGLFWALAEVWILLILIKGVATARGKPGKWGYYALIFPVCALMLTVIAFGGPTIAARSPIFRSVLTNYFYRSAQWHFFCTLWVVLEGVIMVYIYRIYVMLMRTQALAKPALYRPGRLSLQSRMAVVVLASGFFGFLLAYEYGTLKLLQNGSLSFHHIDRISWFYINICGVFWVIFDGAVAVIGYKIYRVLVRRNGGSYGNLVTLG